MSIQTLSRPAVQKFSVAVVKRAIQITRTDFTVIEGVRTKERQKELLYKGVSKTMNSRHITGHAVDIVPVKDGVIGWRIVFNGSLLPEKYGSKTAARKAAIKIGRIK